MRIPIYCVAATPLLFAIAAMGLAFAEEPAAVVDQPVEAKPEPTVQVEVADEPLNLEAVAAPLRALFGGAIGIAVMEAPNAADAVAQNDAMNQQFLQQFRPMLHEELGFIRLVCNDLAAEQRPKIKAAGEAGLKKAAKEMASLQNRQNRGMMQQASTQPEPRKIIREGISKALKEMLTAEQMERFTHEANDRTALRKQAAILCVVSRLDGCLCMTHEQRDKIIDAISTHWQDKWEQWLMMNSYGDQYFPVMPDQYVTPHLNAEQKSVWQGLQKIDFGGWWNGNGQNQVNDVWWGEDAANEEVPAAGQVIRAQVFELKVAE